jgi:hypothetical protein
VEALKLIVTRPPSMNSVKSRSLVVELVEVAAWT